MPISICCVILKLKMLAFLLVIVSLFSSLTQATEDSMKRLNCTEDQGECANTVECDEICGCSRIYYYNETTNSCELNLQYLKQGLVEKYNTQELSIEDELAKKLRLEADRLFSGIIVSVFIFVACASVCALAACAYCIRVNYTDRQLRKEVQALAEKLQRDGKLKKPKKERCQPKAESCNIIVEDAGVFVV